MHYNAVELGRDFKVGMNFWFVMYPALWWISFLNKSKCSLGLDSVNGELIVVCYWLISCDWQIAPPSCQ